MQVWSFSPPADVMDRSALRGLPPRPLSETGYHYGTPDESMTGLICHETSYAQDDIDMSDAGPSTAPPKAVGRTFFRDD
jgi:F-box and WD-40 domain protein CDC4